MKCYISSSCATRGNVKKVLDNLMLLGYKNIELTGNIEHSESILEDIYEYKRLYKLDLLIHNYLPFSSDEFVINIASRDASCCGRTLHSIENTVQLLRKLGEDLYTIHPGFKNDLFPELKDGFFTKDEKLHNCKEDFYSAIDYIIKGIIKDNFKIAIENLHPKSSNELYSFLCTPDDISQFLKYYQNKSNVGLLLDLGHLNITAGLLGFNKYEILDKLFCSYANKIFEIHISDNNGLKDLHSVSNIDSWQVYYLEKNKRYINDIPVVMEWHNSASKKSFIVYEMIKERLEK